MPAPVFLVREQAAQDAPGDIEAAYTLRYRFVDEHPDDGFAAWETMRSASLCDVDVAARCRDCEGGFRQQALNRIVGQALVREQPAVLVISGLWGCTIDLPRIAAMLGVPAVLVLPEKPVSLSGLSASARLWVGNCLAACRYLVAEPDAIDALDGLGAGESRRLDPRELPVRIDEFRARPGGARTYSYSTYEFTLRDHPLLTHMQQADTRDFADSGAVLDIACGAGIFLECLGREGIAATGVERDPLVAGYAREMGLDVVNLDALEFLRTTDATWPAVYCSHFIEHLPIEVLEEFIALLYRRMEPGGLLVLVFPDPESIRSQLLGFWRDPEHVRFYHPELVVSLAAAAGFSLEWSSCEARPHRVAPFPADPPALPELPDPPRPERESAAQSGWAALLEKLGLQSVRAARQSEARWRSWAEGLARTLGRQQAYLQRVGERTDVLWRVNETWAWDDNAKLRLRRNP